MLSYVHAYHAGNHADILKHVVVTLILEHLRQKETPFAVIDTHAGSGIYSTEDERLLKTGEFEAEKVIEGCPDEMKKYAEIVGKFSQQKKYPGSPLIENFLLRPEDRQVLSELHPQVFSELKESARRFPVKPEILFQDGWRTLLASTPPKERRGLCVIDPSFEDAEDFDRCAESVARSLKKWRGGIFAIWYPLTMRRVAEISSMKERISLAVDSEEPKTLDIRLEVKDPRELTGLASLYGSGMLVVNFPYRLDEKMERILPFLCERLSGRSWAVEKR